MDYLDFELRVGPADTAGAYPVDVLHSPAGQARGTMRLPFDAPTLERHLQGVELAVLRSAGPWRDVGLGGEDRAQPVADFGRQLFEALLSGPVHESFRRSQDRARAERKGLRVRLRVEAPDLAVLPWEYLYDPAAGDYVCLSSDTPLVRYLAFDRPPEPLLVRPPLAVLCVVASPSDRGQLDAAHERRRVEAATAALVDAGQLTLEWLAGSTARDLQRAMRRGTYHVLHFVGHGGFDQASGEGVVALTGDDGRAALLSATQLGRLLADHDALRLVVLNACLGARGSRTDVFSSTAATLVRRGVPAVVAMQYEISDGAAVEFARSLYEALADGWPVDAAVSEARKAVSLAAGRGVEWGTPVLHMRSPDGVLFRMDPSGGPARRTTGSMRVAPNDPARPPEPAPPPPGPGVAEQVRALRARLLMETNPIALRALAYEAEALRAAHPLDVEVRRLHDQVTEALRPPRVFAPGPAAGAPVGGGAPPRRRSWGAPVVGAAGLAASVLLAVTLVRSPRDVVATAPATDTLTSVVTPVPVSPGPPAVRPTARPTVPLDSAEEADPRPAPPSVRPAVPAPGRVKLPSNERQGVNLAGPPSGWRIMSVRPASSNAVYTPSPGDTAGMAAMYGVVFRGAGAGAWTVEATISAKGTRPVKRMIGCDLPFPGADGVTLTGVARPGQAALLAGRLRVPSPPAPGVYALRCTAENGQVAYEGTLNVAAVAAGRSVKE